MNRNSDFEWKHEEQDPEDMRHDVRGQAFAELSNEMQQIVRDAFRESKVLDKFCEKHNLCPCCIGHLILAFAFVQSGVSVMENFIREAEEDDPSGNVSDGGPRRMEKMMRGFANTYNLRSLLEL